MQCVPVAAARGRKGIRWGCVSVTAGVSTDTSPSLAGSVPAAELCCATAADTTARSPCASARTSQPTQGVAVSQMMCGRTTFTGSIMHCGQAEP